MRADPAAVSGSFAAALLDPQSPVPHAVKGRSPRRFAVYRNNVTFGLVRAMEANFPAIRRLLGETYFAGLAREFVQVHPPTSPLLFLYGTQFPAFLEAQGDLAVYPYLSDVARLEQQWRLSYHEADAPLLQPSALAGLDEQGIASLRLVAHPAAALLKSKFASLSIFLASRFDGFAVPVDFTTPEHVLVTRPALDVRTSTVSVAEFTFLSTLWGGEELGLAADLAMNIDSGFDLVAGISLMLQSGAFQDLA